MAIQHVVMFRFHEGTDPSAVDALATGLRRLPTEHLEASLALML